MKQKNLRCVSEKTGDNLIFLDDPKLRKEYLDCMRYLLMQITDFGFAQEEELGRSIISHTKYRLKTRESILAKMEQQETGVDRGECVYLHK